MINKISGIKSFISAVVHNKLKPNIQTLLKEAAKDTFVNTKENIKTFVLTHLEYKTAKPYQLTVTQNPADKAILYRKVYDMQTKKTKKIPEEIGIAQSKNKWMTTYHFLEPETNKEIGFVTICDWQLVKKYPQITRLCFSERNLLKNYPKLGIRGKRITIDYLQNNFPEKYSGIGKAADQIAIEYCLKTGIKPVITSIADLNSHAAHYLRGRRFFTDKKLISQFGTSDPNEIIRQRIKETPTGEHVRCSDLGMLDMYMPQSVVKKYLNKIKNHPILH